MPASFFFYDLETSGIDHCADRVMQFAGQRTDLDLNPIGEPFNLLIKLTPDVLPNPEAILLTGVTPQSTLMDGLTEAEFLKYFFEEIVLPDTIFLGYNSVRFDDEFMRFMLYRNFYDAYEWQWCDNCSRWDLLDVVRMTRALKPEGIEWPHNDDGTPTNRLELITKVNGLDHENAHDALSDVNATIAVARLIREKQPKLFEHLLTIRHKKQVRSIITDSRVFVYSTGKYPKLTHFTSVATFLAEHESETKRDQFLVYDLRHDPTPFLNMTPEELVEAWEWSNDPEKLRLPIKTLKCNRCPAVLPGFPQDPKIQERLQLTNETVQKNLQILNKHRGEFAKKVLKAVEIMDASREEKYGGKEADCDGQLYDGFAHKFDKPVMSAVRAAKPEQLMEFQAKLRDKRLKELLSRYKARNYPKSLTDDERAAWEAFCQKRLADGGEQSRLASYFKHLEELAAKSGLTENQRYLLEELRLYGESLIQ
jgi:exodeoxyribonuclease-1